MATGRDEVIEERFRAMGSDVHVLVVGGSPEILAAARHRIDELETRWSRFRPNSEISRLNGAAGSPVAVSDDTLLLVERAIEGWRLTGGSFDPLLLDDLTRLGYDRTFDDLRPVDDVRSTPVDASDDPPPAGRAARPSCTDIEIADGRVTLPAGCGFDPGGIGKGLAADLTAQHVIDAGASGVSISTGGDLRVLGTSPTGQGWTLAIEHPWCATPIALVGLWDGAVATSSVLRRRWRDGDHVRHHLIDPETGASAATDVALASVVAGEAWVAEVLAKSLVLRGRDRAFDLLDGTTAGLVVDHDGRVTASSRLADYLGGIAVPERLDFDEGTAP